MNFSVRGRDSLQQSHFNQPTYDGHTSTVLEFPLTSVLAVPAAKHLLKLPRETDRQCRRYDRHARSGRKSVVERDAGADHE